MQGMTHSKRYANHAGGRKYDKAMGKVLAKNIMTHKGAAEKLESSEIFKQAWDRCRKHEGYLARKEMF
jgi:hypothetical protein